MALLPDTWNNGLRMRRRFREHFTRHRLQMKALVSDPVHASRNRQFNVSGNRSMVCLLPCVLALVCSYAAIQYIDWCLSRHVTTGYMITLICIEQLAVALWWNMNTWLIWLPDSTKPAFLKLHLGPRDIQNIYHTNMLKHHKAGHMYKSQITILLASL